MAKVVPRPRLAALGTVIAVTALLLYAVTPRGVIDLSIGVALGVGVGLVLPAGRITDRRVLALVGLGAVSALVSLRVTAVLTAVSAIVNVASHRGTRAKVGRRNLAIVSAGSVLCAGLVLWVAGNDPTVQWFGHIVTHGDRTDNRVALTFDDGPDDPFSLEVSRVLDERGAKGTFFEVGKAIDARPEIARALKTNTELAEALEIRGTPGFVIGNEIVPGAIDLATLKQMIANARRK